MNILVRKNIIISKVLNPSGTISATINVDFIPDIMNVKLIMYNTDDINETNAGSTVYSDIVSENIGIIARSSIVSDCYTKEINKPINGVYTFKILYTDNVNNPIIDDARTGMINIMLEFIKYKN